jgi:hypothetical protein
MSSAFIGADWRGASLWISRCVFIEGERYHSRRYFRLRDARREVAEFMIFMGSEHGKAENIVLGLFGVFFGARALYAAYRGAWRPGPIGSQRETIGATWYLRAFLLLAGLWAIYVALYFLRR